MKKICLCTCVAVILSCIPVLASELTPEDKLLNVYLDDRGITPVYEVGAFDNYPLKGDGQLYDITFDFETRDPVTGDKMPEPTDWLTAKFLGYATANSKITISPIRKAYSSEAGRKIELATEVYPLRPGKYEHEVKTPFGGVITVVIDIREVKYDVRIKDYKFWGFWNEYESAVVYELEIHTK